MEGSPVGGTSSPAQARPRAHRRAHSPPRTPQVREALTTITTHRPIMEAAWPLGIRTSPFSRWPSSYALSSGGPILPSQANVPRSI